MTLDEMILKHLEPLMISAKIFTIINIILITVVISLVVIQHKEIKKIEEEIENEENK